MNVETSFPIPTSNGKPGKVSLSSHQCCSPQAARASNGFSTFPEVFGNSPLTCHWPETPQPAGWCSTLSYFTPVTPCAAELLPPPSCATILWHRQCTTVLAAVHSGPQEVAHGTTYDRGRSSDGRNASHMHVRTRRGHASIRQSEMEPNVSRRRPLEPKRQAHARPQGAGPLYCDLPAPAGRSARSMLIPF